MTLWYHCYEINVYKLALHGIALLYKAKLYQRTHTQTHENTIEVHNNKHNIRRMTTTTIDEILAFYFLYSS